MKFLIELLASAFILGVLILTWALCETSSRCEDQEDDWRIFK